MSVLYYRDGSQWWCRDCKITVRSTKNGDGHCHCTTAKHFNAWEAVCRKCMRVFRDPKRKWGFSTFHMPFSKERLWRFSLFGWTAEWAFGSCDVDVSGITPAQSRRVIANYEEWERCKAEERKRIAESVPEEVQKAALNYLEWRDNEFLHYQREADEEDAT